MLHTCIRLSVLSKFIPYEFEIVFFWELQKSPNQNAHHISFYAYCISYQSHKLIAISQIRFILLTNCFLLYATLILHLFLSSITFTNIIWMWQCCKHEGRRDKDGKIHANSWKKCFPPTHTYTHNHAHRQTNCIGQKRRKKNKIFSLDVRVVCVCGSPIYQRSNIAFHGQFGCDFAVCIVPYGREVLCTVRMTKIK